MESLKCANCGLVNFKTDKLCKRCGIDLHLKLAEFAVQQNNLKFPAAPPPPFKDRPNLFQCHDCGNPCSMSAMSCPKCGKVFRGQPTQTQMMQVKKTSPVGVLVLIILVAIPALCILGNLGSSNSLSS